MAVTEEFRFKRMLAEYTAVRDAQDRIMDRVDSFEAAVLGLNEGIAQNRQDIAEIREMLQATMAHLKVPYKPTMGFMKDEPPID